MPRPKGIPNKITSEVKERSPQRHHALEASIMKTEVRETTLLSLLKTI